MWPSSRRLALRGRNLTRDNQADGVPMVHQASGGESCQRLFFSRHRTPEPCLKKSILVSCTPQRSEKPAKTRSNRTFRADYHPHALQKSLNFLYISGIGGVSMLGSCATAPSEIRGTRDP